MGEGSGIPRASPYVGFPRFTPCQPRIEQRGSQRVASEAQVREALRSVMDPEIGRPIEEIGMLRGIEGDGGKSSVTGNLAVALAAEGHRVGVLDADVWGFSVPRMLGVSGKPVGFNDMILPLEAYGVKVISMGFFVAEETPVIWRGPMLHKAIEQFLGDVYWGDVDFLLCDLPPGTGDVSISLASFLPGAQMLVVTTPQEAARKVAERAGKMAERTHLRPVGVIENMSWFECPHCGEREEIFGSGGGQEAADTLGVPLVGQIPLYPPLRKGGDAGTPLVISEPDSAAALALRAAARRAG